MAHAQKPDFVFRRNGRVHLNRPPGGGGGRCQISGLLAAELCTSAVVMLDTPCSEVVWRVLATHCIRQYPLHTTSEHGVSSIPTADAHTSAGSSRLNWRRPRPPPPGGRFKWTRPFRRKTKSGFCACAITFQLASTTKMTVGCWQVTGHARSVRSQDGGKVLNINFFLGLERTTRLERGLFEKGLRSWSNGFRNKKKLK